MYDYPVLYNSSNELFVRDCVARIDQLVKVEI